MEEYEQFGISKFGIELHYPTWWEWKVESGDTYLFWDEYTGSFRITPMRMDLPGFALDEYLKSVLADHRKEGGAFREFGGRKFVCFIQENPKEGGVTQSRFYISGEGNVVIACSFSYDKSLLDDEFTADQLDAALEEVELILAGINFGMD